MPIIRSIVIACAIAAPSAALAQVAVTDAWVRGTVPAQKATGAFMQLKSAKDAALVGVTTPVAGIVEIHEMKMDGAVMRMGAVPRLELPAGKVVALEPGGYHVMLMDLKQPLKEGDSVPVTLAFQDKGGARYTMDVKLPVRALGATPPPHKH